MNQNDASQVRALVKLLERSIKMAKLNNLKPMRTVIESEPDAAMLHSRAVCPHCGRNGQVAKTFGIRNMGGGVLRPQSWCRDCRKDPNRKEAVKYAKSRR